MRTLIPILLLVGMTACKCPEPAPPQIVKVPVPVPCSPIFLPEKPPLPISQIKPETTNAERERLILMTLRILVDRAQVLEDLIRAHNEKK